MLISRERQETAEVCTAAKREGYYGKLLAKTPLPVCFYKRELDFPRADHDGSREGDNGRLATRIEEAGEMKEKQYIAVH